MLRFQPPGDPVELAVDLLNTWDELAPSPELLRDVDALRRFAAAHGLEAAGRLAERDLAAVRGLRDRLRAAFELADEERAVAALNRLLLESGAVPQLERGDGGWRFRAAGRTRGLAAALAADAAMALLTAIRDDGWERFGVCAASPCCCVFVDRSKNRSRRYCTELCADRAAQAAYRRRRRAAS